MVSEEAWICHPLVVTQVGRLSSTEGEALPGTQVLGSQAILIQLEHHGVSHLHSNDGAVWLWPKVESPAGGGAGQRAPMRVPGDIKTPPGETSHYLRPLNPGLFASNQPLYILKTELKMGQDQSPSADSPLAHGLLFCHHFQLPAKGLLISQTQHCI